MGALKLLLDTHILLWWLSDNPRLARNAGDQIAARSNQVLVSIVSLWEIVVKIRAKKLDADINDIERATGTSGFERLRIDFAHLTVLATLASHHRDPFDHLLVAQAISEKAVFVTHDRMIKRYPVEILDSGRVE